MTIQNGNGTKFWFNGLPFQTVEPSDAYDLGAQKYWFDGQPITPYATGEVAIPAISPSLVSDDDIFFTPIVVGPPVSLTPSLVVDADVFFAPSVGVVTVLTPLHYTDPDTFYAPVVSRVSSLAPSHYTDPDNFFAPSVFIDNRFIDVDIFYPFVTTTSLFPSWYRESDTTYPVSVSRYSPLLPSLVIDTDTFFTPRIGQEFVQPGLIVDADTVFSTTVVQSTPLLLPPFVNSDVVIYPPSISKRNALSPSLVSDTDTFRAPTILRGPRTLLPSRVIDPDIFLSPIVGIEQVSDNPPGGDPSNLPGNLKYVSKYLMPQSGLILSLDLRAGSAKVVNTRMVIYRDVAGVPGALAGVTADKTSVVSGVNNYTLVNQVSVLAGENIWMGLHSDGNFSWFLSNQQGGSRYNTDTWVGGASDPFGPVNIDNKKAPIVIYYLLSSNASITVDKVTDIDAFHAPTVVSSKILLPPLVVDEYFYTPLVRSAWTIVPEHYDSADTFYVHALSGRTTIRPAWFAADDVIHSPFFATYIPTVFSAVMLSDDVIYDPVVTLDIVRLLPLRVPHDDVIHLPLRSGLNTVTPPLAVINDVFYTPIVSKGVVTIAPQPVDSGTDIYPPDISVFGGDHIIRPDLYIDPDVFYSARKAGNAGWRKQVYVIGTNIDDVDIIGLVPTPELVE